jgi:hypothetical protein
MELNLYFLMDSSQYIHIKRMMDYMEVNMQLNYMLKIVLQ